jgi:hypothetical protein
MNHDGRMLLRQQVCKPSFSTTRHTINHNHATLDGSRSV